MIVNTVQKVIIVLGIALMVYFGFVAPVTHTQTVANPQYNEKAHGLLFAQPKFIEEVKTSASETANRIFVIALATGGLVLAFKDKKKELE